MVGQAEITASFLAGLVSFFAPCLLPLLPTYFSVITGFTFSDLYGLNFARLRGRVFLSTLFFGLGFSLVFTLMGITGTIVGELLEAHLPWLLRLTGLFLVVLGLIQTGIVKIPSLTFDYAWNVQRKLTNLGNITAVVTSEAAALSWIPCVGPLLSPILLLAARSETAVQGGLLLFSYSLGLTLPFLLAGLFFPQIAHRWQSRAKMFHQLSIMAGIILILFGLILVLDQYRYYIDFFYALATRAKSLLQKVLINR